MKNSRLYVVESYVKGLVMDVYVWATTAEAALKCTDDKLLETFGDPENVYTLACYDNDDMNVHIETEKQKDCPVDGFLRADE